MSLIKYAFSRDFLFALFPSMQRVSDACLRLLSGVPERDSAVEKIGEKGRRSRGLIARSILYFLCIQRIFFRS